MEQQASRGLKLRAVTTRCKSFVSATVMEVPTWGAIVKRCTWLVMLCGLVTAPMTSAGQSVDKLRLDQVAHKEVINQEILLKKFLTNLKAQSPSTKEKWVYRARVQLQHCKDILSALFRWADVRVVTPLLYVEDINNLHVPGTGRDCHFNQQLAFVDHINYTGTYFASGTATVYQTQKPGQLLIITEKSQNPDRENAVTSGSISYIYPATCTANFIGNAGYSDAYPYVNSEVTIHGNLYIISI